MSRRSSSKPGRPVFSRGRSVRGVLQGTLAVSLAALLVSPALAQESARTLSQEVKDVFEKASPAVVKIRAIDEHSEIRGTGFFIDPTGTLYTSYTVGGEADNFSIEYKGKEYPAKQIVADIRSGVALLK